MIVSADHDNIRSTAPSGRPPRGAGWLAGLAAICLAALPAVARAGAPLEYLSTEGPAANPIAVLGWGLLIVSMVVITVIVVSVLIGVLRRRPPEPLDEAGRPPLSRGGNGMPWLYIGISSSVVVLLGCAVWTFVVLAETAQPPERPVLTVDVTAHQWWWEVQYHQRGGAERSFVTANEIHIPVGKPVRVRLRSADVIHSFWVPALAGKTDVIPGMVNKAWLEAQKPGVYRGQCAEYCGLQHAHMAFQVVAQQPKTFKAWWKDQVQPAASPVTAAERRGRMDFQGRCSICHTVRGAGFTAAGQLGPDLTHVASRRMIASGLLPNTTGNMAAWIANAQALKPGTGMPTMDLQSKQLLDIVSYVQSLH